MNFITITILVGETIFWQNVCEKCDHRNTFKTTLGYACADCDYESVSKQRLNLHTVLRHDGERISCVRCDYWITSKHHFRLHMGFKHDCDSWLHLEKTLVGIIHFRKIHFNNIGWAWLGRWGAAKNLI